MEQQLLRRVSRRGEEIALDSVVPDRSGPPRHPPLEGVQFTRLVSFFFGDMVLACGCVAGLLAVCASAT